MGMVDLLNAVKANISASILIIAAFLVSGRPVGSTAGVFVIDSLIGVIFIGGLRAVIRLIFLKINKKGYFKPDSGVKEPRKTVVIAGAGGAGEKILREIRDNPRLNYEVIGFLDDDRKKTGLNIHGTFVLGGIEQLEEISKNHRLDEVIIAIPSATGKEMRRVVEICNRSGLQFRTTPVLEDIISGKVKISKLRNVSYEDILGRTPVVLETGLIETYLRDKRVLVTGAGGSIGSELCWQISHFSPSSLILCDNTENNLFHVDMDLREEFPSVNTCSVLSDVRNLSQMEGIFKKYKPDVIFHAAAYKHVPMMELNPWEAVHNNIRGTMNILSLASNNNVERFVMVSTDKAVRPCNIMGATKRVAELLTQAHALNYNKIRFMTVRFGNVLGSKGSVIPIFKEQIKRGGPVKVTHPEITRYFMTISEASQLILQAGAMGEGAEIFILDMGTPVRIVDIARDLIRLSGLESNEDIEIEFIGLRPGEKLHEELITEGEGIVKTAHEKIMVLKAQGLQMDKLNSDVEELIDYAYKYDAESIKRKLKEIVPDYNPYDNDAGDK
jgi:FlaA1/EpsC-like NDP-sugar epimerase